MFNIAAVTKGKKTTPSLNPRLEDSSAPSVNFSKFSLSIAPCLMILVSSSCFAQQVVVDWAAKKVNSQPARVEKDTKADVRIDNVNDMMFTYSVSYQLKPVPISDFDSIAKAFSIAGAAAGEATGCDYSKVLQATKAMTDAETAFRNQPATKSGCTTDKPCDISLTEAEDMWKQSVQPKLDAAQQELATFKQACSSNTYDQALKSAADSINGAAAIVNGPHSITKTGGLELSPDYVTSLEIDQIFNGKTTTNGTYSVDIQPSNNRLTLSAGALFSEVQNRSYSVVAAPSSSGTGSSNVLSVSGNSKFNPTAVALLNYEIPGLDWERLGFAVSSGPVFRLGSKSDTSSFGYFAGISIHLFHRLYITPGEHLGEYAGFPAGFTSVDQSVPAGLATPVAVKRWTWRFGIALSYKAKDFSQFGLSSSVNKTSGGTSNANAAKNPNSGSSTEQANQ